MDRADVPRVGPGGDGDPGVLERFQVLQRDIVGLPDAIEDGLGLRERGLDAIGNFVGRQLRHVERRDHFGVAPRFFFRGEIQLAREGAAVTFEDNERRREDRAALFQKLDEALVDQLVGHAMDEEIGAFFDRDARGLELGGVHRHPQLARVAFLDDRVNNGPEDRRAFGVGLARRG